jgi:hypothetical protein
MRRTLAMLCCLALLGVAGCATTGGVHVEGRANQVTPPPTVPPPPSGTPKSIDAVAVLRADRGVSDKIKAQLVPCSDGRFPVDERYSDLTGDGVAELVVTVLICFEKEPEPYLLVGRGYAGYVYDTKPTPPVRLFAVEEDGVELLLSSELGLALVQRRYGPRDEPCCPTDQTFSVYQWNGTEFVVTGRK